MYKIEDSPIVGEHVAQSYGRVSEESVAKRKAWLFARDLKRNYGITPEEYYRIWEAQGKICACCGSSTPQGRGWCVDHDHETRKVRGILCAKCNLGIGQLGDNLEGVLRAYNYLLKRNEV